MSKVEMIEAYLQRDVQRRVVAREVMARCEIEFKQAADEYGRVQEEIEEHLLDLGEAMGLGEPPPNIESD